MKLIKKGGKIKIVKLKNKSEIDNKTSLYKNKKRVANQTKPQGPGVKELGKRKKKC